MDRLRSIGERKAVVRSAKLLAAVLGLTLIGAAKLSSAPNLAAPRLTSEKRAIVAAGYANLPLSFEPNLGQTDAGVRFLAHGPGYTLFLTRAEAVLSMRGSLRDPRPKNNDPQSAVVRIALRGAASSPSIEGVDRLPAKSNYFIGNDPNRWRTEVPNYARIELKNVYPGIDLIYHGVERGQLEYDFRLAPGADPKLVRLSFKGGKRLALDRDGNLVVSVGNSKLIERAPVIYQGDGGERRTVAGRWVLRGADTAGFRLARYDRRRPIVIDPVLVYSSYLGGSGGDSGHGIAVDSSGDAYVTGDTFSTDFPTTSGVFQTSNNGTSQSASNAFVSKFNPSQQGAASLVYSTFLGGSGHLGLGDDGAGIVVDSSGKAYVAGTTFSSNFPTTSGAFQTSNNAAAISASNAFVTELNSTGTALIYSTYLGGSGTDHVGGDKVAGIALGSSGKVYVTGSTYSADFPTTSGAFQTSNNAAAISARNAFVTELNSTGTGLNYSTYLGGSGGDTGAGIAIDSSGDAYITGAANSTDFPTTSGAFQTSNSGHGVAFVTELNSTGTGLNYSTYLGGSGGDAGAGIAVDSSGDAHVTGSTFSTDFPTTSGVFQTSNNDASGTAFVTELNSTGTALNYSTYLGGSGDANGNGDAGAGIAVDSSNNTYVTGQTYSTDFPTTPGVFQTSNNDAFSAAHS